MSPSNTTSENTITKAMTTRFTPPSSCHSSWTFEPVDANHFPGGLIIQNAATSDHADPACFPSGFSNFGKLSAAQVFSPGYCPEGYASANEGISGDVTSAACCPSNFEYFTRFATQSGLYAGCASTLPMKKSTLVAVIGKVDSSTQVTGVITMWAQPIQVKWAASDLPMFVSASTTTDSQIISTATTDADASGTSSFSDIPNASSKSSGLSTGGAIGVGVGVGVTAIAFLAAIILWLYRRHLLRKRNVPGDTGTSANSPSGIEDLPQQVSYPSGCSELRDTSTIGKPQSCSQAMRGSLVELPGSTPSHNAS